MKQNRQRGFTLVELMISITLLCMLLALGYQIFYHLWGTYDRTQRQWLLDREANRVITTIQDSARYTFMAELSNTGETVPAVKEGQAVFCCTSAGLMYVNGTAAPVKVNELTTQVTFRNRDAVTAPDKKVTETVYPNMVFVTVISTDEGGMSSTLSSGFNLPNVHNSVATPEADTGPYNCLLFKPAQGGSLDLTVGDMTGAGCFVATAAYGSYEEPSVMLLRRLRDDVLLCNPIGKQLVDAYYRLSPPLADAIREAPLARVAVRLLLLPLIGAAVALLYPWTALLAAALVTSCARIYKKRLFWH